MTIKKTYQKKIAGIVVFYIMQFYERVIKHKMGFSRFVIELRRLWNITSILSWWLLDLDPNPNMYLYAQFLSSLTIFKWWSFICLLLEFWCPPVICATKNLICPHKNQVPQVTLISNPSSHLGRDLGLGLPEGTSFFVGAGDWVANTNKNLPESRQRNNHSSKLSKK